MNHSLEYEIFLLPEWVKKRQKSHAVVRLIGSFLDQISLQLATLLTDSDLMQHFTNFVSSDIREWSLNHCSIEIVFLPVTITPKANLVLKQKLFSLVSDEHTDYGQQRLISEIITIAERSLAERREKVKQLLDLSPGRNYTPPSSSESYAQRQNIYLFGDITAKFLQKSTILPQIKILNRTFHGIPINYTPETFLQDIILPEYIKPPSFGFYSPEMHPNY